MPLEVDVTDATRAKIVLIAGVPSNKPGQHEYFAGCALMHQWLSGMEGVAPVLVGDGWPKNEAVLDGARCVVFYMDGGEKLAFLDDARWQRVKKLADAGAGLVALHQAVDCPEGRAEEFKSWFGAVFHKDIGCRGHWDVSFPSVAQHATTAGVTPFDLLKDGWLYNLHFAAAGVTPVLAAAMPDKSRSTADAKSHAGRAETVAWAYERAGGGRSFGFTGADLHSNWAREQQRRLLLNGILWSAKVAVPQSGASSTIHEGDLAKWMDRKIFTAKPKAAAAK